MDEENQYNEIDLEKILNDSILEEDYFSPKDREYLDDEDIPDPFVTQHENTELLDFPDGSKLYRELDQEDEIIEEKPQDPYNFSENLAFCFDDQMLNDLGNDLNKLIDQDEESQKEFMITLSDCINLLGINPNDDAEQGDNQPFDNACNLNSMALFETSTHLEAMVYNSFFDSENFISCSIIGESNPELDNAALRKRMYLNNYFNNVAPEIKKEMRKSIKWTINAGSNYKKVYIDPLLQRPTSVCLNPNEFIVNRTYPTHLVAPRKTHVFKSSQRDVMFFIKKGIYKDIDLDKNNNSDLSDNDDVLQETLNQISSIELDVDYQDSEIDTIYTFRECHCLIELPYDIFAENVDVPLPYIVTIEESSGKIVKIVRNWKQNDVNFTPIEYFVNYICMPSFYGEGLGLVHYARRLSENASRMYRLLINSSILYSFPGGLVDSGLKTDQSSFNPSPGEFKLISSGGRNLSEMIINYPYREPPQILFELIKNIEESIKRPAAIISQEMLADTARAPMGTVLFTFENMQRIPNMLLQNFYESFKQELKLFNERFYEWIPEDAIYTFKVPGGDTVILREDFNPNLLVIPEGEATLKNTSYSFLQAQAVLDVAKQAEQFHNMHGAFYYFYKNMGMTDEQIGQILLPPPQQQQPFSGDPISENSFLLTGKPVAAIITQDHKSHKIVHQLILMDPNTPPDVQATTRAHMQEHDAQEMMLEMQTAIGIEIPQDPSQLSPEEQNHIAVLAAQVAQQKIEQMQAQMQPPPPPIDPVEAQIKIEEMKVAQRKETEDQKYQYEMSKLMLEKEKLSMELQIAQEKLTLENKKIELEFTHKENKRVSEEITEDNKLRNVEPKKKED